MGSKRQRASVPTVIPVIAIACAALGAWGVARPAVAEAADEVAFVAFGSHANPVGEALSGLVPDAASVTNVAAAEVDPLLDYVIAVDTDAGVVQIYRRSDGARFERRFETEAEDSYALALVAAELLEVAQSGADPTVLGLASTGALVGASGTGRSADPTRDAASEGSTDDGGGAGDADGDPGAERGAPQDTEARADGPSGSEVPPGPGKSSTDSGAAAFSVGAGIEAWTGLEEQSPWLAQPTVFFDVLWRVGSTLLVGAGVFGSGFGSYGATTSRATLDYRRYDVGARVTGAFDVSRAGPRLLGHVRGGGGVVVGEGRTLGGTNEETRSESVGSWFIGLGVEARQPLVAGLELYLEVTVDILPAPTSFIAFGESLADEGPLRLAGRLGLGWRIE
ncbi:MAG: hypothetical protein JRH11_10820 [Deltaproteobacteria bacterium]|nr:hypothetical protein [Deltaproteobacteria bacterium]